MERPSLTPFSDRMEIAISQMLSNMDKQEATEGVCKISLRVTKALMVPVMRSLGAEFDMRTDPKDVMGAFIATVANVMASVINTLIEEDNRAFVTKIVMSAIADDIETRLFPQNVPEYSKTSVNFDIPNEGTA